MPTVDQWPHEVQAMKDGAVTFKPIVATIKTVVDGQRGPGWKFEEDPTKDGDYTGVTWWSVGEWSEAENAYLPYKGPKFAKGQRVNVQLRSKEGKTGKTYYNAQRIEAVAPDQASETEGKTYSEEDKHWPKEGEVINRPAGSIGPEDPAPAIWTLPSKWHERQKEIERRSIEQQVVLKADAEIIVALGTFLLKDVPFEVKPDGSVATPLGPVVTDLTQRLGEVWARYERLAAILSHLPEKADEENPAQTQP